MRYDCPHCSSKGIGPWRRVAATPFLPARCASCGKASYVSAWSSFAAAVATEVLLWGSLAAALLLGNAWVLLALPAGLVVIAVVLARLFPLVPANDFVGTTRRKVVRRALIGLVLAALALAVYVFLARPAG